MLPPERSHPRRTALGRAGYDYQLEEWRPLGRRRGARMRRRELFLALATGMMGARAVRAQQKAMPVIGWLSSTSPGQVDAYLAAFRQVPSCAGISC
jgi:hypothetical protein